MRDIVPYSQRKHYELPSSLAALRGPGMGGTLYLDHSIIWAPNSQTIHLESNGLIKRGYTTLINEGTTEQQERWLNRELLMRVWPTLSLPWRVYEMWESKFPELPENRIFHGKLGNSTQSYAQRYTRLSTSTP
ncbi:hypothetical protein [Actinotignum sp. GS-2025c]|uniref:hypothetical protein n=1 Tax=Actinotignum sp. GS-2025c TaxID=3427276 RepID=UPI003F465509